MIHCSCDRCNRSIDSREDLRYVVRMEVKAAVDIEFDNEADRDHLREVEEILELAENSQDDIFEDDYLQLRYDFCSDCYRDFLKNPMAREKPLECNFSKN